MFVRMEDHDLLIGGDHYLVTVTHTKRNNIWSFLSIVKFCVFVWSISAYSRTFHSCWDVTFAGEGLQTLTYTRHSWPLSSEGSLTCHTHCGLSFITFYLRGPETLTPTAERLAVELSLPIFTTWVYRDRGSNPDLPHARRTLSLYSTAAVYGEDLASYCVAYWHNLSCMSEAEVCHHIISHVRGQ